MKGDYLTPFLFLLYQDIERYLYSICKNKNTFLQFLLDSVETLKSYASFDIT